jgi:hypothetical protein
MTRSRLLGSVLAAAVVVAVIVGLLLSDSPAEERARRRDDIRRENLSQIENAVSMYWTRHGSLPPVLDSLPDEPGGATRTHDPFTNAPYEYARAESTSFSLCATFESDNIDPLRPSRVRMRSHESGHQCFPFVARNIR